VEVTCYTSPPSVPFALSFIFFSLLYSGKDLRLFFLLPVGSLVALFSSQS